MVAQESDDLREVSHFLFIDWALAAPTVNTLGEYSSYDGTGIHNQKLLARQTSDKNIYQSAQRADDNAQLRGWSRGRSWAE